MAIMMKRQLNEDEKQIILNRHGRCCYANGHAIPDGEKIHFDHIKAFVEPLQDNILSEKYKRDVESENIVRLMNLLFEKTLINWNPSASQNDTEQIKLSRMFSSKSIMAWSELFKDAISAKLEIYDTDEKSKVFYRQLEDSDFEKIDQIIIRLVNWQMWDSPKDSEIDKMISNNKSTLKQWLKDKGLSTGYLMGASE